MDEEIKPPTTGDPARCAAPAGSASSEAKTEPASRHVWWLARLAMLQSYPRPQIQIGDTVVESTHLLGLARHRLGLHSALGELIAIEGEWPYPERYLIRSFDPTVGETWWFNARVELVEQNPPFETVMRRAA
jgi:hypothetical protein